MIPALCLTAKTFRIKLSIFSFDWNIKKTTKSERGREEEHAVN